MNKEHNYIQDIAEIRSMMERSSKFLSLSGWAGILAGVYALAGAFTVNKVFGFNPDSINYTSSDLQMVILSASIVLVLAIGTAVIFSQRKASQSGEKVWNAVSKQLISHVAVPLIAGGALTLILLLKGLIGLLAPLTLIFYGLALYNAGKFTFDAVKFFGLIQVGLGLIGCYFVEYGLILWAFGFGVLHIVYGAYIHFRYER
ncbi:MAG: hypothetical protein RLN81_01510 [Balneolaceae bacterium]